MHLEIDVINTPQSPVSLLSSAFQELGFSTSTNATSGHDIVNYLDNDEHKARRPSVEAKARILKCVRSIFISYSLSRQFIERVNDGSNAEIALFFKYGKGNVLMLFCLSQILPVIQPPKTFDDKSSGGVHLKTNHRS